VSGFVGNRSKKGPGRRVSLVAVKCRSRQQRDLRLAGKSFKFHDKGLTYFKMDSRKNRLRSDLRFERLVRPREPGQLSSAGVRLVSPVELHQNVAIRVLGLIGAAFRRKLYFLQSGKVPVVTFGAHFQSSCAKSGFLGCSTHRRHILFSQRRAGQVTREDRCQRREVSFCVTRIDACSDFSHTK
jgi:hypothetical protein